MKTAKILTILVVVLVLATSAIGNAQSKMYWTDNGAGKIQRANLDGSGVEDLVTGLSGPYGIDVDLAGGKMYWTDLVTDKIQRANLDGSAVEDLVTGLMSPAGIALDVVGGKMYWIEGYITGKIQRANLDGSGAEELVTGISGSYGIALDVAGGKMYWTEYDADTIQRANLDGSGVEDLVTNFITWPSGIALDVAGGKMYWTDVDTYKIQRANLDGTGVEGLVTNFLMWPIGIALDVTDGKMYWTESVADKIQRANLDGSGVEDLVTGLSDLSGIALALVPPIYAFSYQGHLYDNNSVADGLYDFAFKLYDEDSDGDQVGGNVYKADVDVIDGYFAVELDFGEVFNGEARWLEIGVRPGASTGSFTTLSPRQEVMPTPYAIYAKTAGSVTEVDPIFTASSASAIQGTDITNWNTAYSWGDHVLAGYLTSFSESDPVFSGSTASSITAGDMSNWNTAYSWGNHSLAGYLTSFSESDPTVLASVKDGVSWGEVSGIPAGFADGIDDVGGGADSDWTISGDDMYSIPTGNVGIGTTAPAAKLTVNGAILRSGSTMYGAYADTQVNLGSSSTTGTDGHDYGQYATVSGGENNTASRDHATVGGGQGNNASDNYATVAGGQGNNASDNYATVGGGYNNIAGDGYATVGGGHLNKANGTYATVGGGYYNETSGLYATVGGGHLNKASGLYATVGGGKLNTADGMYSFAAGYSAKANHQGAFVWADSTSGAFASTANDQFLIRASGGVGIGTSTPGAKLDVAGTAKCQVLEITGGADIAEPFDVKQADVVKAGMVLSVDPENAGKLKISEKAYDHCVAGIISGAGGLEPGMLMGQKGTKADGEHPVALTGRVYALVDATYGAVEPGDLLTTSATPGYAMKATDRERSYGAVIGKAMSSLEEGKGLVLVLVTLQ